MKNINIKNYINSIIIGTILGCILGFLINIIFFSTTNLTKYKKELIQEKDPFKHGVIYPVEKGFWKDYNDKYNYVYIDKIVYGEENLKQNLKEDEYLVRVDLGYKNFLENRDIPSISRVVFKNKSGDKEEIRNIKKESVLINKDLIIGPRIKKGINTIGEDIVKEDLKEEGINVGSLFYILKKEDIKENKKNLFVESINNEEIFIEIIEDKSKYIYKE